MRLLCPNCGKKGVINCASKNDDVFFFCPHCGKVADMCIIYPMTRKYNVKRLTSPDEIKQIGFYYRSGMTIDEIAQMYGVTRQTIYRASKTNEDLKKALTREEYE